MNSIFVSCGGVIPHFITNFQKENVLIMYQTCLFDQKKDLCRAIPGLSTDLAAAVENGVVLDTGIDAQYNNVDDPANIRGRVRDAFAAIDQQRAVLAAGRIVQNNANPSVNPTGENS